MLRKSVAKIEAVRAWGLTYQGVLQEEARGWRYSTIAGGEKTVRVRVIREADYQRLRRAAGKG